MARDSNIYVSCCCTQAFVIQTRIVRKANSGCSNNVEWCESIKYLGVYLQSGKYVKFNINSTKRAFYAECNCIFLHSSGIKNDMTLLHLQETYSLSELMYTLFLMRYYLPLDKVDELHACWNNVIRRSDAIHSVWSAFQDYVLY